MHFILKLQKSLYPAFKEGLKTASDELWQTASGRLFHACGPATVKSRASIVERRVAAS